ncbi:hypothetical protein Tco_1210294 [Tanacetum coccineum]
MFIALRFCNPNTRRSQIGTSVRTTTPIRGVARKGSATGGFAGKLGFEDARCLDPLDTLARRTLFRDAEYDQIPEDDFAIASRSEEIDLTFFPLAPGPYVISYPFEGDSSLLYTKQQWDGPHLPKNNILCKEIFRDPDVCRRALDQTITPFELRRTESLLPLELSNHFNVFSALLVSHDTELNTRYTNLVAFKVRTQEKLKRKSRIHYGRDDIINVPLTLGSIPVLFDFSPKYTFYPIFEVETGKENGVNILMSIDEGPFQMGTFRETVAEGNEGALHLGLPKDIYTLINHYTDAKDIWDNVKMLLEGSELTKEDRESQLYDDFKHFRQNKGETIHDYYVQFAKLINDIWNIKMTRSRMQLNSKFVNNMLPEWGRFVTAVKLNRGLRDSNYDQLYAYLKQHKAHANENKMMLDRFTQHTVDPLALMSNVSHQQYYSQSSITPPSTHGQQNRGQGNNVRGTGVTGYGGAQNRDGNANLGGQDNAVDEDMDEQPVQDLALNVDNVFQADDCDAFDSDVDEDPTAKTMFMANLSSADPVYDEASPSYNSDILSEVTDHDNYQDTVCEHHEVHEMHDKVQPNYVVNSHADYTSDSNMIPYDQYVKENAVPVVQSVVSSVPNDAYMMILNNMHEQSAQCVSMTTQNNVVDKPLTAELATYKEQVKLYERRAKFELTEREQNINEQLRIVITNRNINEENLKRELHSVKMQLNSTINHNKSMVEEVTSLKKDFKQKENKYLEEFLDMKALKEKVGDRLFKQDQSLQTVHMLCKPKPHYDEHRKDLLKMKEDALKEHTTALRPIKALMVYPPNTPATLIPRRITPKGLTKGERGFEQTKECYLTEVIPFFKTLKEHFEGIQKALTKEIKEMKEIFEELEAEVDQNVVNRKYDEFERKNILITNDNLIADCLSKEVFYIATNPELTVSRFTDMHNAYTAVQARCLELEAELSKLKDKIQKDDHNELVKCFSNLEETCSDADHTLDFRALDFQIAQLTEKVTVLQEQNELFKAENEKVKQHYKKLYDYIKITRAKHIEQTTALLTKNETLKVRIKDKMKCVTIDSVKPKVLTPSMYSIDFEPIPPLNRNNREVHLDYLKYLKESVETLREIVEEARLKRPLDRSLASAFLYTKHSQELLEYAISTSPKDFNKQDNKHATTPLNGPM